MKEIKIIIHSDYMGRHMEILEDVNTFVSCPQNNVEREEKDESL